jgi:WD repeat-containing protein 23
MLSERVSSRLLNAHKESINSICYDQNENLIFTGSDDMLIKLWDKRILGQDREAGAFIGHIEGIAHVCSKDDGRFLASNGKD